MSPLFQADVREKLAAQGSEAAMRGSSRGTAVHGAGACEAQAPMLKQDGPSPWRLARHLAYSARSRLSYAGCA